MINVRTALAFLLMAIGLSTFAQSTGELIRGTVSYVTGSSVYVRFENTEHLNIGDTLFVSQNEYLAPALVITNKSSLSCVCSPLPGHAFQENDQVVSKMIPPEEQAEVEPDHRDSTIQIVVVPVAVADSDTSEKQRRSQLINGRVSVSSYTNWSNAVEDIGQRMRYTFSFSGQNLGGSKVSLEMYTSFVHRSNNWDEITNNISNGLKIYNFSLRYDITPKTRIWFGRKINYKLTSLGAIDGLQFEQSFGSLTLGVVAGSRPDYEDYSINFNLFQAGAYLSHDFTGGSGRMENTLAFMNQTNDWNTDRRFMYFQHTNTLLKNLFFLGTAEFDLYTLVDGQPTNTFDFSNLYLLLRYRILKNLSLSASYMARQNIVYYEAYKDYLERLLEEETLQGFRLMLNYRPAKHFTIGAKAGYRFRPDDPRPSKDLYGYIGYSMIPGIKASATASVTWLETTWLNGWVYSLGLSRDLVSGRLFAGINYRYVSYDFTTSDLPAIQHITEVNLNWRIYGKLTMGAYYEGAFESANTFSRVYVNLTQRF